MSDSERRTDLPEDEHLHNDVAPESEDFSGAVQDEDFSPGLTNAGQQVGGLASAAGYGEKPDDDELDSNNPV